MSASKLEALLDYIDLRDSLRTTTTAGWRSLTSELSTSLIELFEAFEEPLPSMSETESWLAHVNWNFLVMDSNEVIRLVPYKDRGADSEWMRKFFEAYSLGFMDLATKQEWYKPQRFDSDTHRAKCALRRAFFEGNNQCHWPALIEFPPFKKQASAWKFVSIKDSEFRLEGNLLKPSRR